MITEMQDRPRSLRGARVLLLEDDALISIDAEDMLTGLGAQVLVAHTVETAAAVLSREAVDAAILDVMIGTGKCDEIARLLEARTIPFVFASGYADSSGLPDDMKHVPHVAKPYSTETLATVLATIGFQ